MNRQPVAITGIGAVTPIGIGRENLRNALAHGRSGIAEITSFDTDGLAIELAGEVADFDIANHIGSIKTYLDRTSAFALAAAAIALAEAKWIGNVPGAEIGLCLGTAWGCQDSIELYTSKLMEGNPKFAPPLVFTHGYANAPSSLVSIEFGLRGYNTCFAGGWTVGATALESAVDLIRRDPSQRLLAGGADALSEVAVRTMLADDMMTAGLPRPFDASADGLLPGEAAALLALESPQNARSREAEIFGYILGTGSAGGADGAAALSRAIGFALDESGIDRVDAVFASASGLRETDAAEAAAIAQLPGKPPVVAIKSLIGEPCGAWAPVAVAAAICCIEAGVLPATANFREPIRPDIHVLSAPIAYAPATCLILNLSPGGAAAAAVVSAQA